jgi:hypothetical protein
VIIQYEEEGTIRATTVGKSGKYDQWCTVTARLCPEANDIIIAQVVGSRGLVPTE